MDIIELRRRNLLALIQEAGSLKGLAKRAGTSSAYLCQCKTVRGKMKKIVGNDLARRLEKAQGKTAGWMDQDHSGSRFDPQVLAIAQRLSELGPDSVKALVSLLAPGRDTERKIVAGALGTVAGRRRAIIEDGGRVSRGRQENRPPSRKRRAA